MAPADPGRSRDSTRPSIQPKVYMRIVFLGAPGSGKGTQATLLKTALGLAHISTGELLRSEVAAGTELGRAAKAVMERGELVSDAIVLGMLERRMSAPDVAAGFILDGYPRNLAQAEALDALLARLGQPLDRAVFFDVPADELLARLTARAEKEGRADDSPESVAKRLEVYAEQTAPVIEHFERQGKLLRIAGLGSIDAIQQRLRVALGSATA
jgi:adenylate kinase